MPTSEKLPPRDNGAPFSRDVFAYELGAGWQRGAYDYDGETGNEGSWSINGEVVNAREVTHWMPMPPDPK
jgi:hypothetical protein